MRWNRDSMDWFAVVVPAKSWLSSRTLPPPKLPHLAPLLGLLHWMRVVELALTKLLLLDFRVNASRNHRGHVSHLWISNNTINPKEVKLIPKIKTTALIPGCNVPKSLKTRTRLIDNQGSTRSHTNTFHIPIGCWKASAWENPGPILQGKREI